MENICVLPWPLPACCVCREIKPSLDSWSESQRLGRAMCGLKKFSSWFSNGSYALSTETLADHCQVTVQWNPCWPLSGYSTMKPLLTTVRLQYNETLADHCQVTVQWNPCWPLSGYSTMKPLLTTVRLQYNETLADHCQVTVQWNPCWPLSGYSTMKPLLTTVRLQYNETLADHCQVTVQWNPTSSDADGKSPDTILMGYYQMSPYAIS